RTPPERGVLVSCDPGLEALPTAARLEGRVDHLSHRHQACAAEWLVRPPAHRGPDRRPLTGASDANGREPRERTRASGASELASVTKPKKTAVRFRDLRVPLPHIAPLRNTVRTRRPDPSNQRDPAPQDSWPTACSPRAP